MVIEKFSVVFIIFLHNQHYRKIKSYRQVKLNATPYFQTVNLIYENNIFISVEFEMPFIRRFTILLSYLEDIKPSMTVI